MPVNLAMNHDDTTVGIPQRPEAFIRLIKGKTIRGGDYNDEGGNVNWFTVEFTDGTWITIHDLDVATCIYTIPPRR
jgi:hypothetical protein